MIARARHIRRRWYDSYEQNWGDPLSRPDHTEADASAVRLHNHLKVCSCLGGCGNPRRGGFEPRLTRQERLADLYLREEIEELRLGDEDDAM